jgi:hypothetical protein
METTASTGHCSHCQKHPLVANLSISSLSSLSSEVLLKNLQHYGWSPIIIEELTVSSFDVEDNEEGQTDSTSLVISPPTRQDVLNLFQSKFLSQEMKDRYQYRASTESGGDSIEPKESLEVQLANASLIASGSMVDQWCLALSKIAHRVCECLDIPPDTMLTDTTKSKQALDLMRVFHYHATDTPQLGSSPHTDWGSWTIVWQDSVGGLETYCRKDHRWVAVPPPQTSSSSMNAWHCIVHVGDMASLALERPYDISMDDNYNRLSYCWPSPKHRVLTSSQHERASLVYFGYPPSHTSLNEIRKALKAWKPNHRGRCLSLNEYYLLQNQSSAEKEGAENESSTYSSIEYLSIQQVIEEKWNQVQRASR